MKIIYSKQAKDQLYQIKEFISLDSKKIAVQYLSKIKKKLEILIAYPYIGTINPTMNSRNIRDYSVFGYKVIYKINSKSIAILTIYKNINFDEEILKNED